MLTTKKTDKKTKTAASTAAKGKKISLVPDDVTTEQELDDYEEDLLERQNELWDYAAVNTEDCTYPDEEKQIILFVMMCYTHGIRLYDVTEFLLYRLKGNAIDQVNKLGEIYMRIKAAHAL